MKIESIARDRTEVLRLLSLVLMVTVLNSSYGQVKSKCRHKSELEVLKTNELVQLTLQSPYEPWKWNVDIKEKGYCVKDKRSLDYTYNMNYKRSYSKVYVYEEFQLFKDKILLYKTYDKERFEDYKGELNAGGFDVEDLRLRERYSEPNDLVVFNYNLDMAVFYFEEEHDGGLISYNFKLMDISKYKQ